MSGTIYNHDCGMYGDIKIFAGTGCPDLADEVACYLEMPLSDHTLTHFANDNLWIQLNESVRGQDVYIIQSTSQPVHTNLMEFLIMLQPRPDDKLTSRSGDQPPLRTATCLAALMRVLLSARFPTQG